MAEIEGLVRALREGDNAAKVAAATALFSLACNYAANKVAIAAAGGIPPLVELLRDGSVDAKAVAARALRNLAYNDANKVLIAEAGGIDGGADAKEVAAWALNNLACNDDNQVLIAEAGAIPLLVDLLRDGSAGAKYWATYALGNIAHNNDANAVAIAVAVGFDALVQLARCGRVTVDHRSVVDDASFAAKRKAALVVAALLRACVPDELRSRVDVQDVIRGVIGPCL
jgi:vacuolar protein 8